MLEIQFLINYGIRKKGEKMQLPKKVAKDLVERKKVAKYIAD